MSDPRRARTTLKFNGTNVTTKLKSRLESVTYTDVASGASDELNIVLHNIDYKWMHGWFPTKGDKISGSIRLYDWNAAGKDLSISCGTYTLDEVRYSGSPTTVELSAVSAPAKESFSSRERSKTWESVSIKTIARTIAKRYGLSLTYSASTIKIAEVEQSESDSEFLYGLCEDYGLAMKVYKSKIVIYDQTTLEKKSSVATLKKSSFSDGDWTITDGVYGTYTGARISYKKSSNSDEISIYTGLKKENASGSRVLRISETCDSRSEAYYKAAAQVNLSNQEAVTLSGTLFVNPKVRAGVTVKLTGFGKLNGKYFVDKSTIEIGDSGTKQSVEMHKCQKRLVYKPSNSKKTTTTSTTTYSVGDKVTFAGGKVYVSSASGAKSSTAKSCTAKINAVKSSAAHPYYIIHTGSSGAKGWVDADTLS